VNVAGASVLLLSLALSAASLGFALHVEGETQLRVTLSGPASELSPGSFRGSLAINGSSAELPVTGNVSHSDGKWKLPVVVRYADVPGDWADRFRPESFAYRLRGSVGGAPRVWTGTRTWKEVEVDGSRETLADFLRLSHVALTRMSLLSSEARAELSVRNPFSFPLKIAETRYALLANSREVGDGGTRGMILHPAQKNVLTLPIEIDHAELISAAGRAVLSGGEVDVRLQGRLVIRLKGGDIVVPLNLAGHLSGVS
jgi:LEA14-like dessication related protein